MTAVGRAATPTIVTYLLVCACAGSTRDVYRDEYSVYRAVLLDYYDSVPGQLVLIDTTLTWSRDSYFYEKLSETLGAELVDMFLEANERSVRVLDRFGLAADVHLVPYDTLEVGFKREFELRLRDPWDQFYERYPEARGYDAFSRVGFSRDGDSALVLFEHTCGGTCYACVVFAAELADSIWAVRPVLYCGVA